MEKQITVWVNGERRVAAYGSTLSEIIEGEKPCGGHGKCGKCRVIAEGALSEPAAAERGQLSAQEMAQGVRLACLTRAYGACRITTVSAQEQERILLDGSVPDFACRPTFAQFGVAVDLGTTTLAARLYGVDGRMLAETSRINPQQQWGADVISRIEAALGGEAQAIAAAIRGAIHALIEELAAQAQIEISRIDGVVITGNTVMLSLLTEECVEPFSHAPFHAKRLFGEVLPAQALSLTALQADTAVYLPPCISAFVGADTVCALLATELCGAESVRMLVDIGTNGEMALWKDGALRVCSTAAGPAFEGVGISCGMRGGVGAIDAVRVVNGALFPHVIGQEKARGICGSGVVDAAAALLDLEWMDETGYLEEDEVSLTDRVKLTQEDIRALQLAKSAIYAGLSTLVSKCEVEPACLETLFVAGGFGSYLNMNSAVRIGLIPAYMQGKTSAVGNAALAGAAMLLLQRESRDVAQALARQAEVVDLATDRVFAELYMNGMLFGSSLP